jgi:hypothetical protein
MRDHQVEGVRLLQGVYIQLLSTIKSYRISTVEIYRAEPARRRECLYYLALGHYKMGNFEEARKFNGVSNLLLEDEIRAYRTRLNLSPAYRERTHESSSSVSWTTHRQGCSARSVPFLLFLKCTLHPCEQKATLAWPSLVEQQLSGPSSSQASYGEQLADKFNCTITF